MSIILLIFQSCGLKTAKEVGLHFSTEKSKLPDSLTWKKIGFAKELINQKEMIVFFKRLFCLHDYYERVHLESGYHRKICKKCAKYVEV